MWSASIISMCLISDNVAENHQESATEEEDQSNPKAENEEGEELPLSRSTPGAS
jgi:hypothetical protein